MSSFRIRLHEPGRALMPVAACCLLALAALVLTPAGPRAMEFEASTPPKGGLVLETHASFYYASAYFDQHGYVRNLEETTGLLVFRVPVYVQYGVTSAFSVGGMVPIDLVYGEAYFEDEDRPLERSRFTVHEFWINLQYKFLTSPFLVSVSMRTKVPLAEKYDWYDGLRVGDGQVDLFPVVHLDYFSRTHYWFIQTAYGHKYRLKNGDINPHDESHFHALGGVELFPELKMRMFLLTDIIRFKKGSYPYEDLEFYEKDGNLNSFGYGVSLWPRPTIRIEIATAGDLWGENRYRGMYWTVGFTKIF
ncbi:MAG: hypothetical protein PVJ42_08950 [bacterium]